MLQCRIVFLNGSLGFERPQRECRSPASNCEKEWLESDLDDVRHDVLHSPPADSPTSGQRASRYARSYRSQSRLVNLDGVATIQWPTLGYSGSPENAMSPAGERNNGTIILKLPVEIRIYIYKNLLVSDRPATLCPDPGGVRIMGPGPGDLPYGLHPQILATCRQINREGTSILYSENAFQRDFSWRRKYSRSGIGPWPRSDSSPLTAANLSSVLRVRLFRGYNRWFSDSGYLKALREFPSLRELQAHVDLNDIPDGVDLKRLWKDTIEAVSGHRPHLVCFKAQLRLSFDEEYRAWCDRHRGKDEDAPRLDFSIHRTKKVEVEQWMRAHRLFEGRELAWTFTT